MCTVERGCGKYYSKETDRDGGSDPILLISKIKRPQCFVDSQSCWDILRGKQKTGSSRIWANTRYDGHSSFD